MALSVVILAAGRGTRMRSTLPKVLHKIGGQSLLEHVVDQAIKLGAEDIHVVYGHGGDTVLSNLASLPVKWVCQAQQLGTGHAVDQAMAEIPDENNVLVLYGDVPLTSEDTLTKLINTPSGNAIGVLTVNLDDPDGYGRIVRSESGDVVRIVEHRDADGAEKAITEVNTGILVAPKAMLNHWLKGLTNSNSQGEYYLTDVIELAVSDGVAVRTASPSAAYEVLGVNDKSQLAYLERIYQKMYAQKLMIEGVTLADPDRIDVRGKLSCGLDVVIDVNSVFEGEVVLGSNSKIGPNCVIINSSIGANVEVLSNTVIDNAYIGDHCRVGPFARIRPATELAGNNHVGNFVEIKKSKIGLGSKINHLSYVGDAIVGKNVNIGAGTITCNYDGANKHLTEIGDDVFVGSDTQLVAPVKIGDGATIGAGSTITKNVVSQTLTLSRSKQMAVKGWKRPQKNK